MSKISTYEVAPVPKLSDKLIGTSVGGEIEDITYNFTLLELLELFLPIIPANNLQGVLDYGNTATQDINLFGTITTTNLEVTDTSNLFITYLNEETHLVGSLFDSADSVGTAGQVLTSTGDGVEWFTLPPIFTPNLEQVLTEGNTSSIDILLDANLEALDVSADTATVGVNLTIGGTITDNNAAVGSAGQVLSSTVTGVAWVSLPVYSATSPLLFNSATGVFSIQVANSTQGGYLTANDWVTFDGKQNAGAYITALTGEATATGPGSVPITLNNASVTAKVLTGLNVTGGSISASDSILTAFGKVQSQINGLMGGVQYQGVWDAATNTPTLTSSVGTQGHYYIVNVAGNTDLNGITDWKVGDWAIFSGGTWQKVDNTESVTSVNGQTGAVSLTTDNIPEGATNLYYLDSRARAALSFAAGSGAYNSLTGVITIPTNNNQILNGANYITLASLSATSPLAYNNLTGVFSIQQADATHDGYLSSTDWSTFNNKQNYLGGTGLVKSTAGTITYITDNSGNWNTAYNRSIVSAAVTGTTTKTLTLNEQDGNTITASWTDLDTGLTSVGVSMPSAFSVANSPLTANGTIAVTGAGTTLEYIDGTGALRTFPGLTGYVPYTGATTNVDLGEFGISAGYFQADLTPTGALQVGRMQWNSTDGTMDLRLLGNNVTLQIGQENVTRVVNKSGIDLLEANYQVVRVRKVAEGGAQGQRLAVVLAQGNNENNSTEVLGLVTETINVNQEGFITAFGEVKEINTTGSLQGETWVDGDILYVSTSVAGQLTNVRPVAPNHAVTVGYVTYAHAVHGKIYMAIDTGYELGELHNVYAPSPTANQSIYWDTTNSRYQLNTIGGILGYTPANAATTISTTAPLQGGGDLSANRTFSITQSGASTDGYLSSTDWNTFNNKQPAGSYVPTSRQLSINGTAYDLSADRSWSVGTVTSVAALTLGTSGTDLSSTVATATTTPVITLNVPTASAANRGALSAADWSTFNTKVGSVTASSPLASSGGQTPNITIQQSSGSQDGYLSSTDWTTFNNKQASGNYITSLTGEATGTGPGATAVTLNNASVTAKILTGINITGGTVQATDTMLTAFGKLQNQINGLIGSTIYQGTWNASTNTPALASGVGVRGYYYIVSVAGNTNLDGITDWFVGDWAIFDGTAWQQVDNTDAVVSVNGQTGAVSLTTDNIPEGATNQYFLNSRARAALSFTAGSGAYNSTTGVITIPTNNNQITNGANYITLASLSGTAPIVYSNTTGAISITQAGTASNGYLSSTDWNTFNNKQSALTNPVTGTGTNNRVAKFTTTGSTIGNSNISDDGGSVTIIGGTAMTGGWNRNTILEAQFPVLVFNGNNTKWAAIGYDYSVGYRLWANKTSSDVTTGSTVMFIANSGYVEIYNYLTSTSSLISTAASISDGKIQIGSGSSAKMLPYIGGISEADDVGLYYNVIRATNQAALTGYTTAAHLLRTEFTLTSGTFLRLSNFNSTIFTIDYSGIGTFTNDLYVSGTVFPNEIRLADGKYIYLGNSQDLNLHHNGTDSYVQNATGKLILRNYSINALSIETTGDATFANLAGTGTRMVVANASGTVSTQAVPTGTITGGGSQNYIAKFDTAGGASVGNSTLKDDGSRVDFLGTGTIINGGWSVNQMNRSIYPVIAFNSTATPNRYAGIGYEAASGSGMWFWVNSTDLNGITVSTNAVLTLRNDRSVDMFGILRVAGEYISAGISTGGGVFATNNSGIYANYSTWTNTGGAQYIGVENSTGGTIVTGSTGYDLILRGKTGIGFSSNDGASIVFRLASTGAATFSNTVTTGDALSLGAGGGGGGTWTWDSGIAYIYSPTSKALMLSSNGSYASNGIHIATNNNVTIGGTDASQKLRVNGSLYSTYNIVESASATGEIGYFRGTNLGAAYGTDSNGAYLLSSYWVTGANSALSIKTTTSAGAQDIRGIFEYVVMTGGWNRVLTLKGSYPILGFHSTDGNKYAGIGYDASGSGSMVFKAGSATNDIMLGQTLAAVGNNGQWTFPTSSSAWKLYIEETTNKGGENGIYIGSGYYPALKFVGYNGIATTSKIVINTFATGYGAQSLGGSFLLQSDNSMQFSTNGDNVRMTITTAGFVGIGRNTSNYSLSVSGTINAGYVLLGDNGNGANSTIEGLSGNGTTTYGNLHIQYYASGYLSLNNGGGNCYIGALATADDYNYKLSVAGTIHATGDVIAYSDISVKKNIRPIENVLEKVINSRGVIYDRIDNDDKNNIGFIAQELEKQFPELVNTNSNGTKGVKYQNAVAVLFEAIKEQQKQIDELKKQVA